MTFSDEMKQVQILWTQVLGFIKLLIVTESELCIAHNMPSGKFICLSTFNANMKAQQTSKAFCVRNINSLVLHREIIFLYNYYTYLDISNPESFPLQHSVLSNVSLSELLSIN